MYLDVIKPIPRFLMHTYIALLRGINVGGHRKVPMAELRKLLTDAGFINVKTYIQSGNILFKSKDTNTQKLQNSIQKNIQDYFGFKVSTLVKTADALQKIFDDCPFKQAEKEQSYFAILSQIPDKTLVKEASQKTYTDEEFFIINNCIYFYAQKGYGRAKFNLNYFEKTLKTSATARNYKTMVKLIEMSAEM